jgi:hypothetical protein
MVGVSAWVGDAADTLRLKPTDAFAAEILLP